LTVDTPPKPQPRGGRTLAVLLSRSVRRRRYAPAARGTFGPSLFAPCGVAGGEAAGCPWRVAPRCLRRLRPPRGCPFESRPTAPQPHLTPPQPRGSFGAPYGRPSLTASLARAVRGLSAAHGRAPPRQ